MTKKYVKQGNIFVPQAPHLILRPWQDDAPVPQYHQTTNLSGYGSKAQVAAGGGGSVTHSHLGSAAASGSLTATVNVSPGDAAADRFIIVFGMGSGLSANPIVSATYDGNAMTAIAVSRGSGGSSVHVRGFYYLATSGTANVNCVVTGTLSSLNDIAVSAYRVIGHGTTWAGVEFNDANSDPLQSDGTQDVAANGVVLAVAGNDSTTAHTWDFGGATPTEDADAAQGSMQYSSASHQFTSTQTNITMEADAGTTTNNAMTGVTLDPA